MSQFNALSSACAGVVASTVFGQIGDMMLGDFRKVLQTSTYNGLPKGSISPAEDVAKVLHGLFEISRGTCKQIEVIGGPSCSFIAAFAHWLLNLTIHVEDSEGTLIYLDALNSEVAQVRIRYCRENQITTDLGIASTTYILSDRGKLFVSSQWNDNMPLHVRTPWDGCLNRAFWNSTQRLTSNYRILGEFLGSAARIYAALARGEVDVGDFARDLFTTFIDGTYGQGFIENVSSIFPELGRIKELGPVMLRALNNPVQRALTNLQTSVDSLMRLCQCELCNGAGFKEIDTEKGLVDPFCILFTAITISSLIRLVAGLEIHGTINPTIAGLHKIYGQLDKQIRSRSSKDEMTLIWPPTFQDILSLEPPVTWPNTDPVPSDLFWPGPSLADVQCLFTGYQSTTEDTSGDDKHTAVSFNGICCYIEALHGLSSNAAVLRRVHVLPGRIQKGDREYCLVTDFPPSASGRLPKAKLGPESITPPTKFRSDKFDIKALVREVSNGSALNFDYEAVSQSMLTRIRPGMFTRKVLRRTGTITCDKLTCKAHLVFPCRVVQEGWVTGPSESDIPFDGLQDRAVECSIWPFRENDIGRCVAISVTPFDDWTVIRNGECLPCCTKAVSNMKFSVII